MRFLFLVDVAQKLKLFLASCRNMRIKAYKDENFDCARKCVLVMARLNIDRCCRKFS